VVFLICTATAAALQYWGAPQFHIYSFEIGCSNIPGIDAAACKGNSAVYRVSMGLALWFTAVSVGTMIGRRSFHANCWGFKLLALVMLVTGLFFVPVNTADAYVPIARIVSAVFLVSQIVAFIDVAYHWNAWVTGRVFDDGYENRGRMAGALTACAVLGFGALVALILMFVQYGQCTRSSVFIALTIVLCTGVTVWQLKTYNTGSSLLTSCIVTVYAVYLCWSSVQANPDACNVDDREDPQTVLLGMAITVCSLGWTCYSASTREYFEAEDEEALVSESEEEQEDDEGSFWLFHLVMATGSVYMAMLLTNWGTHAGQRSSAQMWVSIISQWLSLCVYGWTLLAPTCLPDREF
jgi:hypothetical protein|tara:strand:+ start:2208 stop:3263 length:1056 start_codon:yes stop_codon:yes gene_type:complete